jgi:phosphate transport system substrate-binding protein
MMRSSARVMGAVALVAGVATAAAGCGSTSDAGKGNSGSTGKKDLGWGTQICGQGGQDKPGYKNEIGTVSGGSDKLSGAGSTFVAPMMSVWTKDYASAGKVQVAYQSIGSGGGVQQFSAKTVDFGASDAPMKDEELAKAKGGEALHIPLVLGAVVATYNVKGIGSGLKFDGETLGQIFAGRIKKWNDPKIAALNAGVSLPDQAIAVVHRSDGSGTTAVWTDYLTKESPTWTSTLGGETKSKGKEVAWPTGIGGKGNEGVSGAVNQTAGSIGYVELAYALAQKLPYGAVKNKAGAFTQPCVATITKGTVGAQFPPDLRTSLTDGPDPNAYPVTGTVYALVYAKQTDKAKAASLVNFLSWVLSSGQDEASSINYAPLGTDLQQKSYGQVKKITLNGQALAK